MRVGINLLFIKPGRNRGTETYVRGLLPELNGLTELVLFTNRENHDSFSEFGASRHCCPISTSPRVIRIGYEQIFLGGKAMDQGCDLLFCPGYLSPIKSRIKTVVAIHDCQFLDIPEAIPAAQALLYRLLIPPAVRQARAIITISAFSKSRICTQLKVAEEKVFVTYPGAPKPQIRSPQSTGSPPYFLCVSGGSPHKNLIKLIKAFQKFKAGSSHSHLLYIVGPSSNELTQLGLTADIQDVKILGYVTNEKLESLFQQAYALVIPSLYEGFGLPMVEAMAHGTPVLSSNAGSLPEVGADAALFFDPHSIESISSSLLQAVKEPRLLDTLTIRGYKNIQRFSWKDCAEKTFETFERVHTQP